MGTPCCCPVIDNESAQTKFLRETAGDEGAGARASFAFVRSSTRPFNRKRKSDPIGRVPDIRPRHRVVPGAVTPTTIVADGSLAAACACDDHSAQSSRYIDRRRADATASKKIAIDPPALRSRKWL
jgi:hypothetical protein